MVWRLAWFRRCKVPAAVVALLQGVSQSSSRRPGMFW